MPRLVAVLLVYLVLLVMFAGVLYLVLPGIAHQGRQIISELPTLMPRIQEWAATSMLPLASSFSGMLPGAVAAVGANSLRLPFRLAESLLELVLVLVVSIYWLILLPRTSQFALSLVPVSQQPRFGSVAHDLRRAMGGYIRGTAINGMILGVTAYIGLLLLGVRFPLILGLFTFLMEFLPVIGATISVGVIVAVAFFQSPSLGLAALAFGIAFHQIENHVLVPNVMHSQTNISPLFAIFAVFAGAALGGVLGALVAVPVASASQVLAVQVVAPAIRRATGADSEATTSG